jgi:hypothetical protein
MMPMLDEDEYRTLQSAKDDTSIPLRERLRASVLTKYEELTGYRETNPNAVWHHRLSLYGAPCKNCNKPLRSPRAKLCGACMYPVDANES